MNFENLAKIGLEQPTPAKQAKVGDSAKGSKTKPVKDSKALLVAVKEMVKDNSVVDILKAIVKTSTVDKLVKDSVLEALSKVPDAISDYDDKISFEDGAFITEDGSYPTVEQARLALANKAEVKEPVQLSESLSYNPETGVFTKTVVDEDAGTSEVMEYQSIEAALGLEVPEPASDAKKAELAQKKADALTKMRTRLSDTETTEEAVEVAKEALVDVPADEVIQGVIEVLAEVIDKVAEDENQPAVV